MGRTRCHAPWESPVKKPYSAVLTAEEIEAYVVDPCLRCGSDEVIVQWLELAPGTGRYVHGLERCLACERRLR